MEHINDVDDLRTSQAWWASIKTDRVAFEAWLYDQYRGEVTAAGRIEALRDAFAEPGSRAARILTVIAAQERKHARWVAELLLSRGLVPGARSAEGTELLRGGWGPKAPDVEVPGARSAEGTELLRGGWGPKAPDVEVPGARSAEDRYWKQTIPAVVDLETGAAIGAHAESMRLERIEAIAGDASADPDVRAVFRRILPDERFHERAFRSLATPDAMQKTARAHHLGRRVLGLSP